MSRDVHSCPHWLRPPIPALGLVYERAIGQQRYTTSLCIHGVLKRESGEDAIFDDISKLSPSSALQNYCTQIKTLDVEP
jgi:hypothetical protein